MALPERTAAPSGDWASQTADQIEKVVVGLRSKTADPLEHVARIVVYGLLALVLAVAALVLLIIGLVRAIDVWVPGGVWIAHTIVGGIFTVLGLFLWTQRRGSPDEES
jgi:hypothetical protein